MKAKYFTIMLMALLASVVATTQSGAASKIGIKDFRPVKIHPKPPPPATAKLAIVDARFTVPSARPGSTVGLKLSVKNISRVAKRGSFQAIVKGGLSPQKIFHDVFPNVPPPGATYTRRLDVSLPKYLFCLPQGCVGFRKPVEVCYNARLSKRLPDGVESTGSAKRVCVTVDPRARPSLPHARKLRRR
jgi:hypothetical protein